MKGLLCILACLASMATAGTYNITAFTADVGHVDGKTLFCSNFCEEQKNWMPISDLIHKKAGQNAILLSSLAESESAVRIIVLN